MATSPSPQPVCNSDTSVVTASPGAASPPNWNSQFKLLLELVTNAGNLTPTDFAQLLEAIASQVERIALSSATGGSKHDPDLKGIQVIVENIRAAVSSLTSLDVPSGPKPAKYSAGPDAQGSDETNVIVLSNCKANRFVQTIPTDREFTREELYEFGRQRGGIEKKHYAFKLFDDLATLGVLQRSEDGKFSRSNRPVIVKPAPHGRHVSNESLVANARMNSVTPEDITAALRQDPPLLKRGAGLSHAFGTDRQDGLRLAVAVASGISLEKLCSQWCNAVPLEDLTYALAAATGKGPRLLITAVKSELLKRIDQELKSKVVSVAKRELQSHQAEVLSSQKEIDDETLATELLRVGTAILQNAAPGEHQHIGEMSCMPGVSQTEVSKFVRRVLESSSPYLKELLQDPAVRAVFSQKILLYLSGTKTLQEVTSSFSVSRQTVIEQANNVTRRSPWLALLARTSRQNPIASPVSTGISPDIVAAFEMNLRRDPATLFTAAKKVNPEPTQLKGESDEIYHRRLMLAAYSGAYLECGSFPAPLRTLRGTPKKYFTDLVDDCVSKRITAAIAQYTLVINNERMENIRRSLKLSPELDDPEKIRQVIEQLVSNPRTEVDKIVGALGFTKKVFLARKQVFDPLVREFAKARAELICKVFDEDWYQPWRMTDIQWRAVQSRFLQQHSLAEGSHAMGIKPNYYGQICKTLMAKFPGLESVAARAYMVHTKR